MSPDTHTHTQTHTHTACTHTRTQSYTHTEGIKSYHKQVSTYFVCKIHTYSQMHTVKSRKYIHTKTKALISHAHTHTYTHTSGGVTYTPVGMCRVFVF